jgi:8-oxo-dGTP pyrophosphatase MutT (NUDIX family)
MVERFRSVVEVHVLLRPRGGRLLLSRRANTGYADTLLPFVSGRVEQDEDLATGNPVAAQMLSALEISNAVQGELLRHAATLAGVGHTWVTAAVAG